MLVFPIAPPPPAAQTGAPPAPPAPSFRRVLWGRIGIGDETTTYRARIVVNRVVVGGADPAREQFYELHRSVTGVTPPRPDDWVDGRSCPALAVQLAAARDIPALEIEAPGHEPPLAELSLVLDGTDYELSVDGVYPKSGPRKLFSMGRVTYTGNVDTPLATWVESTLKAVSSCWRPTEPR